MLTIGVDPHKQTHSGVAVDALGVEIAQRTVTARRQGHRAVPVQEQSSPSATSHAKSAPPAPQDPQPVDARLTPASGPTIPARQKRRSAHRRPFRLETRPVTTRSDRPPRVSNRPRGP